MRSLQKLSAWFLIAALLLTCLPSPAHSQTNLTDQSNSNATSGYRVNPLYASVAAALNPDKAPPSHVQTASLTAADISTTLEQAAAALRAGLAQRSAEICVSFRLGASFGEDDIWQSAMAHTGQPGEGDSLLWQYYDLTWNMTMDTLSGVDYITVHYLPNYFTTAQQEQELDSAVSTLLTQLNLAGKSDYEKLKSIYGWICSNVAYDYDHSSDKTYLLQYTPYAALVSKKASYQGYALLLYRLCLEAGIDCRVISGTASGAHAWNIAGLGGQYYNLDPALDAVSHAADKAYAYFLKGAGSFTRHTRSEEYETPQFHGQYPMSAVDYGTSISWPLTGQCGTAAKWSLSADGVLTISGTGAMQDFYSSNPGWHDYRHQIRSVIVEKNVTTVGAYAFYYCPNLEKAEIRGAASIEEAAFLGCGSLKTIALEQVTAIKDSAFSECAELEALSLGKGLSSFGQQVLYGCAKLKTISVSADNKSFCAENQVLFNRDKTVLVAAAAISGSYSVPNTVRQMGDYAFAFGTGLTEISLPAALEQLPEGAFYGCTGLKKVTFAAGLQVIGSCAFQDCAALETVTLPDTLTTIGNRAFSGCVSLGKLELPAALTTMEDQALAGCTALKTVIFASAPEIAADTFAKVAAEVSYPDPACGGNWTAQRLLDYGGVLQWKAYTLHVYKKTVTPPTCTTAGFTTYTCACGHSYQGDETPATDHSWDSGKITIEPTAEKDGELTYTCTVCGATKKQTIPAHTHDYKTSVVTPTCTAGGYTLHTCSICSHSYQSDPVAALGHSFKNYVSDKNATCDKDGTKTAACEHGCGTSDVQPEPGTALGHDYGEWVIVTPATTQTEGLKRKTCKRCDHYEEQPIAILVGPDKLTSDTYHINDTHITGISAKTTLTDFLAKFDESEYLMVCRDGEPVSGDSLIGTGMELRLVVGEEVRQSRILVVTGDVNGDGEISITDMVSVKAHVLQKTTLKDAFVLAADTNQDSNVSITDFVQIKAHVLGKSTIAPGTSGADRSA